MCFWMTSTLFVLQAGSRRSTPHGTASFWHHARIRLHLRKTFTWNNSESHLFSCQRLYVGVSLVPPTWSWSVPSALQKNAKEQSSLVERAIAVPDLQCAWLLLMYGCSTRANFCLRRVCSERVEDFAQQHDAGMCRLLDIDATHTRAGASMPISMGGLCMRCALRTCVAAFLFSGSNAFPMIQRQRHRFDQKSGRSTPETLLIADNLSRALGSPHPRFKDAEPGIPPHG